MLRGLSAGLLLAGLLAVAGCGGSSGGEEPKVQNQNIKVKSITPKAPGNSGEGGGANAKAFEG